jgi:hypothetical protein
MARGEIRAIRRAMREREGVLRDIPIERLRHMMRREAAKRDKWQ